MIDIQQEEPRQEDIPIVNEFSDVFPKDLPRLPLDREIEFVIDLIPYFSQIFKASYQMAPAELKELKIVARIIGQRFYSTQRVILGSSSIIHEKERWNHETLH